MDIDYDLFLVIGGILAVLCVPSALSAWVDERRPIATLVTVLIAGGMILYALTQNPEGYAWADMPEVIAGVVGRYILG
ncbi:MAG: hypothetical protein ACU0DW_02985 [Shimia sp.]